MLQNKIQFLEKILMKKKSNAKFTYFLKSATFFLYMGPPNYFLPGDPNSLIRLWISVQFFQMNSEYPSKSATLPTALSDFQLKSEEAIEFIRSNSVSGNQAKNRIGIQKLNCIITVTCVRQFETGEIFHVISHSAKQIIF